MNDINYKLLSLLICAMREEDGRGVLAEDISEEEISALYALAKKHDLAHLVGVALEAADPQEKKKYKVFFSESVKAVYRCEWLKGEQNRIFALLEKLEIPYIPLKGAVIREFYREPWHRLSCDIDVLIPQERLDEATSAFEKELSYTRGEIGWHDVNLHSPNGVHLELHYEIDKEYVTAAEMWKDACKSDPNSFRYELSSEMMLLYHSAHMARHFVGGGCGLRPFLDLWLMREKLSYDENKLAEMLGAHGLADFGRTMLGLVAVWFDGKEADDTERIAEAFILRGGVYGDLDNKISVKRSSGEGLFVYALRRIFPPRSSLKIAYPILERHGWLLPICWVRRWVRLISNGKLKQAKREYDINRRMDSGKMNDTAALLDSLGLKK